MTPDQVKGLRVQPGIVTVPFHGGTLDPEHTARLVAMPTINDFPTVDDDREAHPVALDVILEHFKFVLRHGRKELSNRVQPQLFHATTFAWSRAAASSAGIGTPAAIRHANEHDPQRPYSGVASAVPQLKHTPFRYRARHLSDRK